MPTLSSRHRIAIVLGFCLSLTVSLAGEAVLASDAETFENAPDGSLGPHFQAAKPPLQGQSCPTSCRQLFAPVCGSARHTLNSCLDVAIADAEHCLTLVNAASRKTLGSCRPESAAAEDNCASRRQHLRQACDTSYREAAAQCRQAYASACAAPRDVCLASC